MTSSFGAATAALLLSVLLVGLVRRYAVRRKLFDHPIDRSSHSIPTPRGGGAGVVLAVVVVLAAYRVDLMAWRFVLAFAGVLLVALIGWIDDHRSLGAAQRIAIHLAAAACVCPLAIGVTPVPATIGLAAWWIFWGVAAINVVNFMDGSDGLIGAQLLVFGVNTWLLSVHARDAALLGAVMTGASLGFLLWNWPRARIFLGDVGSGAVGLLMVVAGAAVMRVTGAGLVRTFLPLFPIFLDAAWTLARRAHRGALLTEAHREHLYQRMANGGVGHAVTAIVFAGAAAAGAVIAVTVHVRFMSFAAAYFVLGTVSYLVADRRWPAAASINGGRPPAPSPVTR